MPSCAAAAVRDAPARRCALPGCVPGCPSQELWAKIVLELGVHVLGVETHGTNSPNYVKMVQYLTNVLQYIDRITLLSPDTFLKSL